MVMNIHDFFPFFSFFKKSICPIILTILLLSCASISGCLTINQPSNNNSCISNLVKLKFSQDLNIQFNGTENDIKSINNSTINIQISYLIPSNNELKQKIIETYKFTNWKMNNTKVELIFGFIFKPSDNNYIDIPIDKSISFNLTLFISSNNTSLLNMKFFNNSNSISGKIFNDKKKDNTIIILDEKIDGISFLGEANPIKLSFDTNCIFDIEFDKTQCSG